MAKKKKGSGIYIKPENKGKFTAWCKRHGYSKVTTACIEEGLRAKDPAVRKEANFARNARKWKKGRKK